MKAKIFEVVHVMVLDVVVETVLEAFKFEILDTFKFKMEGEISKITKVKLVVL